MLQATASDLLCSLLLENIQAMISFQKKQMQKITTQGYSELAALPFSTILTSYLSRSNVGFGGRSPEVLSST